MSDDAAEYRRLIEALWGYGAQRRAAEYFEVSDRTSRAWASGKTRVPERVMAELRAMVSIAPPPGSDSSEDRDEACRQAMEPGLTELRDRALGAGWHPAEVSAAILSLAVSEIREGAGDAAALELLEDVAAGVRGARG